MPFIEYGTYKGHATITIKANATDKYGFTFGRPKAKLVKAAVREVIAFADGDETTVDPMAVDRQYEDDCQRVTGA
jgi:hypothetical protein